MGRKKKNEIAEEVVQNHIESIELSDDLAEVSAEEITNHIAESIESYSAQGESEMADSELSDVSTEGALFLSEEMESEGFIPEASDEEEVPDLTIEDEISADSMIEGSELDHFESAQIEDLEFVEDEQIQSIIESILFASDRPVSLASIQQVFKGTTVKKEKIRRTIEALAVDYAGGRRGIVLEEVTGGYQLRTKVDNMNFLKRTIKTRAFKLSGPALETLAIIAYKQPVVKIEVDQIRGVESGHLLRALMEKGLVNFEGKAENLPGKPMQYGTTRRFLEIFGLRNLKELPTLSQIDELLPEGIGEEVEEKQTLSMVTESMADNTKAVSYSQGEEELGQIEDQLTAISTSSEFFEQEKLRQKMKRDEEKAQNIREALTVGEEVPKRDINWLKKYEESLLQAQNPSASAGEANQADQSATSDSSENEAVATDSVELTEEENDEIMLADAEAEHEGLFDDEDDSEDSLDDELPMYAEADEEEGSESNEGHV